MTRDCEGGAAAGRVPAGNAAAEGAPRPRQAGEDAAKLQAMANPTRMRILASLRIDGVQTVGQLSARLGEPVGSVSYHLGQLSQAGLVAKTAPRDGDKRKSWWKATQGATIVLPASSGAAGGTGGVGSGAADAAAEGAAADGAAPEGGLQGDAHRSLSSLAGTFARAMAGADATALEVGEAGVPQPVLERYRRTSALALETAYQRFLDAYDGFGAQWQDCCGSVDIVLNLTPGEARQLGAELLGVLKRWADVSAQQSGVASDGATGNGGEGSPNGDGVRGETGGGAGNQADDGQREQVAVVAQLFRWVP